MHCYPDDITMLDLSVTFDSVDHRTLLQRLRTSYGLGGVINWFSAADESSSLSAVV